MSFFLFYTHSNIPKKKQLLVNLRNSFANMYLKNFKYPSAVNVETQKKRKRDRRVNKLKNYNHTRVLCLSCVPFWNTAECEEVSHFNQLLHWKRVCSRMDCLQVSYKEVPKSFVFSPLSTCVQKKKIRNSSMMTDVGHARKQRALFSFSLADHWDRTLSLNSGEGIQSAGLAAFVLCQEFFHS